MAKLWPMQLRGPQLKGFQLAPTALLLPLAVASGCPAAAALSLELLSWGLDVLDAPPTDSRLLQRSGVAFQGGRAQPVVVKWSRCLCYQG